MFAKADDTLFYDAVTELMATCRPRTVNAHSSKDKPVFLKVAPDGRVTLEDRDNFRAFKLVVEGSPAGIYTARSALSGMAELPDETTAWIFEGALRSRPELAQDADWQQNLATMIEKARPHGWIDEARQAIKAHIEWTEPA